MKKLSLKLTVLYNIYKDALFLLSKKERFRLIFIGALVLVSSFSEVVGILSIIPFLSLIANQSIIEENPYLQWFYQVGKFSDHANFMLFLGTGALVVFVTSIVINVLAIWIMTRWTYLREYSIGRRLFQHYLYKPYPFFLNRHSTEFSKNIFTEIALVINGVFIPGLYLISKTLTAITFIVALLIYSFKITLITFLIFGGFYMCIFFVLSRFLSNWGKKRLEVNKARFKIVSEAFVAVKEVLLYGMQQSFIRAFVSPSKQFAELQSKQNIVAAIPKYLLELLAFGSILAVLLFKLYRGDELNHIIPIITVYAISGYRLLPSLQIVFSNATKINFNRASLHNLAGEFKENTLSIPIGNTAKKEKIALNDKAALIDVDFRFDGEKEYTLKKINLYIRPGEKIGIVGRTGCGKTTTVNLLAGLLNPTSGQLVVDGKDINSQNVELWQNKIGYITQQVFMIATSIKKNIAFGEEDKDIDIDEVKRNCRIAQIHEFIENELPNAYDTIVGERGVRLSGGQIQRIGIARALYRKPEILMMDEGTSDLDTVTEANLYNSIYASLGNIAFVIIAHRISSLEQCDRLYLFESGRIIDKGSYKDLMLRNKYFKELATKGSSEHNRESMQNDYYT